MEHEFDFDTLSPFAISIELDSVDVDTCDENRLELKALELDNWVVRLLGIDSGLELSIMAFAELESVEFDT